MASAWQFAKDVQRRGAFAVWATSKPGKHESVPCRTMIRQTDFAKDNLGADVQIAGGSNVILVAEHRGPPTTQNGDYACNTF